MANFTIIEGVKVSFVNNPNKKSYKFWRIPGNPMYYNLTKAGITKEIKKLKKKGKLK